MKKKICFVFIALIFLMTIADVLANDIGIEIQQNPFPVQAGNQGTLTFLVTNNGLNNLTNISFDLSVDNPIILTSGAEKTIDLLQQGQTQTLVYDFYVEAGANGGKEQITLDYDSGLNQYSEDFDVFISPKEIYLQIENVKSNPNSVAPGNSVILSINIKNTADSEIKNVVLALNLKDLPFAPESVSEQRIESIDDGDIKNINFNLIALSTTEIGIYKIPLTLVYYDNFGKKYERTELVSIKVFEMPDINVVVEKDSLIVGMPSKLNLKILNKGLGKISFAEIRILSSEDYAINGNDYDYIGNIESDDYSSVEFNILPKKQNFGVLVNLEYRDANNQKYSINKVIVIQAHTSAEARRLGLVPGFPWFIVIIIFVIIALIIFFIIRRKKKKKALQG